MWNRSSRRISTILLLAIAATFAAPSHGQRDRSLEYVRAYSGIALQRLAEGRVSLDQAVAIVQKQTGGRVLDARQQGNGYRVKVLTRGGDVIVVFVDAKTGDVR
jgi:uncharacterized membrane protein YkoI